MEGDTEGRESIEMKLVDVNCEMKEEEEEEEEELF